MDNHGHFIGSLTICHGFLAIFGRGISINQLGMGSEYSYIYWYDVSRGIETSRGHL